MRTKTPPPSHLPAKLSICYWGWDWLTAVGAGEAYEDLDRAMRETKERGFNCIRPDMGLGLVHDAQGRPRGKVRFRAHFPGANSNLQCINTRGGAEYDVRRRVLHMMELAEKYDLYVIGTTWLYQDMVSDIDHEGIRREVTAVPYNDRIATLGTWWDWLLREIREHGLLHRFAFVELVNEMDCTSCIWPREGQEKPTYEDWFEDKTVPLQAEWLRRMADRGVADLRRKYPELLITVDLASANRLGDCLPEDAQVADHHLYHNSVTMDVLFGENGAGIHPGAKGFSWQTGPAIEENALLASLLRKDVLNWRDFCKRDTYTRHMWRIIAWFYENLDNEKYDDWCRAHCHEFRERVDANVKSTIRTAADFAEPRGLPLVVDEGYLFFPPLNSRFIMSHEGRWGEELAANAAVEAGYWGVLPTGYFRPNTPLGWYDDGQCEWILNLNRRILGK
ncbi:MAG: hypothetical protein GXY33_04470 [Phycisphaerae bacterium]|nr:hypothetical protein [Phycisphaerae bacterium]